MIKKFCVILLSLCIAVFLFASPRQAFAASCPIVDGGTGDGDGSVNGIITINANTTWTATAGNLGIFDCSGLTIKVTNSGTTLTLVPYNNGDTNWTNDYGVSIIAASVTVDSESKISADGLGYAGGAANTTGSGPGGGGGGGDASGAGYGGYGGKGSSGITVGAAYGSLIAPTDLGSGGGGGINVASGAGGGAIKITTTGTLTVDGTISSNGGSGWCPDWCGGAGSGGSIWIQSGNIAGSGAISANGGNASIHGGDQGGSGAGGRIAIYHSGTNTLSITPVASKGTKGSNTVDAENGTVNISGISALPLSLTQYESDGVTSIATGGVLGTTNMVVKASVSSGRVSDLLFLELEMREVGTTFSDIATDVGGNLSFSGSPIIGSIEVNGLADTTSYHWQVRTCSSVGDCSSWTSYGENSESGIDFHTVLNLPPIDPTGLGNASVIGGGWIGTRTPSFTFTTTDPNGADTVQYRIQIATSADFSTLVTDFTSVLGAQGSRSFSISQAAGDGYYTIGSEGQTLNDGSYYWRVMNKDNSGAESSWSTAHSGAIAFKVDGTAPTSPETPITTNPAVSTKPTWTWSSSSDVGIGLDHYNVYWCLNDAFSGCDANVDTANTAAYTHSSPLSDGIWYFRVQSVDALNNISAYTDNGSVVIDVVQPTVNASSVVMKKSSNDGPLSSNVWVNTSTPYFSWTAGSDNVGGSGLKGYCVYIGADQNGNPQTSKGLLGTSPVSTSGTTCQFIVSGTTLDLSNTSYHGSTWLTSSTSPYYINVRAVDLGGNVYASSSAQFVFRFDNTPPKNVLYISAASGSFGGIADMNFGWPVIGTQASSDDDIGLLGWQYQINSTSGTWLGTNTDAALGIQYIPVGYSQPHYLTQDRDGASVVVGSNIIYFRTVDTLGNASTPSTYRTASISYGGAAASFATTCDSPTGVVVTPTTGTSNSFSLSWEVATPSAGRTISSYYYMINSVPPQTLSTMTGNVALYIATTNRTVATSSLPGVVKGSNTVYVVVKDDLDNYSSSNCLKGVFTLNSTLPDPPKNLMVSDASIKSASLWRGSLAWQEPVYKGTGTLTYTVQRSSDGVSWTTIATTSGTAYVDTVTSSQSYYWRVGTSDSSSDSQNAPSFASAVTLIPKGKFTEPADLSSGPTVSGLTTKRATVSWGTGRKSDSKVRYGLSSGSYFTEESSVSDQVTDHSIKLTNLSPGTTYYYRVKWTDEDGNTGTSDEKTFTTDAAPSMQDVSAKNIGLTTALIQFTSTGSKKVKIYYGKTTSFGGIKEVTTATSTTTNTTELTDLDDGTKYYYRIDGVDSEGDEYAGTILDFTTLPRPKISNVRLQEVANTAQTTILVTWETNTDVSSILTYYPEGKPDLSRNEVNVELLAGDHSMLIKGLLPDTRYMLYVKGQDKIGNEAISDGQTFVTSMDTRPASILNLKIIGGTIPPVGFAAGEIRAQLIVTWDTDEPATSQVEYGEGTNSTYSQKTQEDGNFTTNHTVILSNLVPSQVYHLRGVSKDAAGNSSVSVDSITIAPKATKSALDLVVGNLSDVFGVLKGVKFQ